tara:strand:+ start:1811 stop:2464 length:654 start_codon:yes stop_codon:yes gene_type:complete
MKVKIQVPTSLSEITLEQYQKFNKINTEENQNTNFILHKTVEIFCGLDLKDIAKIKVHSVKSVIKDIDNVFSEKPDLIPTFKLKGKEYGFIPKLDDISLGEYIDLDDSLTDWETMHKAMSVLYRPVTMRKGDKYLIEEYDGTDDAEQMKQMRLDVVMGSIVFFYNLNNELLQTILNYLNREVPNQMNTLQLQTLEKNGVGINQSMDLLKEMLPNLMI